ncbi:MAG: MurR/RpiR family transcriptional regulator [Anaerolineae bacterium]
MSSDQDIATRIMLDLESMSKSQQKVARFILDQGQDVIQLSATRIAELLEVDRSTVVRTAQALGYTGFLEMRSALQAELSKRISLADRLRVGGQQLREDLKEAPTNDGAGAVLYSMIQTEIHHLENLLYHVPVDDMEKAVDWLDEADHIYVLGLRVSYAVATNFGMLLRYIRENVHTLNPGSHLVEELEAFSPRDVLFVISSSRHEQDTLRCMDYARHIGAKVIAVTDNLLGPVGSRADLVFLIPSRLWAVGHSLDTFALLNALWGTLFLRHQDSVEERLKHMDAMYSHFHIFDHD